MQVFEDQVIGFEAMILGEAKKQYEQELNRKKSIKKLKKEEEAENDKEDEATEDPFKFIKEGLLSTASAFKLIAQEKIQNDPEFAKKVMLPHKSYTRMMRFIMKNASKYAFRVPAPKGQVNSIPMGMFVANDDYGYRIVEEYYNADDKSEVEQEIAAEKAWIEKQAKLAEERKAREAEEAKMRKEANAAAKEELEKDPEYLNLPDKDKEKKLKDLSFKKFQALKRKREARERARKKKEAAQAAKKEEAKKEETKAEISDSQNSSDEIKASSSNTVEQNSCDTAEKAKGLEVENNISNEHSDTDEMPEDEAIVRQAVEATDQQMTLWDFISM